MRKLRMLFTLLMVSVCSWQSAWAQDPVEIDVTLPEPNSLATEILAKPEIDDVKTVTKLTVVSGTLGDQDWATLKSMTALLTLDLRGAGNDAIPEKQFEGSDNLTTVYLPSNLKTIGKSAFSSCDNLVTVDVPSTVESIGNSAFYYCRKLEECSLAGLTSITAIPDNCFSYCEKLHSFVIPATVTSIGSYAFCDCNAFTSQLPANIAKIGGSAFNGAAMTDLDIVIPEGVRNEGAIFDYSGIKSITFPSNFYLWGECIYYCNNLTDITFKSPTVVNRTTSSYNPKNIENITLHVPSYLVNFYKAHKEWSKFKTVVAIDPDVTDFTVQAELEMNYAMRMGGTPNVTFSHDSYNNNWNKLKLKMTGDAAQSFNNFTTTADITSYYNNSNNRYWTMIINDAAPVTVNNFMQRVEMPSKSWRFMSMPFDFKVSDVTAEEGQFVIRTYDGARRNLENEATTRNNWKNQEGDVVIPAGTGFIIQTSQETWVTFKAKSGGTNYAFKTSADEPKIPLAANNTNKDAAAANTGWNMVGNPWLTWYNTHKINYTAPFCYYHESRGTYETVSIQDDDFALPPLTAIFVQCPTGVSEIGFPASGRQFTDEITDQNGARAAGASERQLLDIQVSDGDVMKDKARLVLNPEAKTDYEIGRDMSKFISSETLCPQVYTLGADGTQYAINEFPEEIGVIRLGMVLASDGTYVISAVRNAIGQVILIDNETGIKTDLQTNDYSFEAKQGICDDRFTLILNGTTGIQNVTKAVTGETEVYQLDGQMVGRSTENLKKGVYIVRQGQKTQKVIIK